MYRIYNTYCGFQALFQSKKARIPEVCFGISVCLCGSICVYIYIYVCMRARGLSKSACTGSGFLLGLIRDSELTY